MGLLKYLEHGHIFLSCDSIHGHVEKNMRRMMNLHNFSDIVSAVQTSGGGQKTIELGLDAFTAWDQDRRETTGKLWLYHFLTISLSLNLGKIRN